MTSDQVYSHAAFPLMFVANFSMPSAPIETALRPEANELAIQEAKEEAERLAREEEERKQKEEGEKKAKAEEEAKAKAEAAEAAATEGKWKMFSE